MNILIVGGTRNMGFALAQQLYTDGHRLTILNRGKTPDTLPEDIERLQADRTVPDQLQTALKGREFDAVVDMTLYRGDEAETIIRLLDGRVGHFIFVSTGQVYLVREGIERPFSEADYAGRLMPPPKEATYAYEEWVYGYEKRRAEDALAAAYAENNFPYTSLRLPMVNSERDHFNRLYAYILRLKDGGPILLPETPDFALRHVYGGDVVKAIKILIDTGRGKGRAYNISQDETLSIDEFLAILGDLMDVTPHVIRVRRSLLEANGFLPDCSPFSERWMSELTNDRSKTELSMTYTSVVEYLKKLVDYYEANPPAKPASYQRRRAEMNFVPTP